MIFWYLLSILLIYTFAATIIDRYFEVPDNINITGPILSVRSKSGIKTIQRVSDRFDRSWSIWGYVGVILAILTGITGTILFVSSVILSALTSQETNVESPTDIVVIPGVNRFLPLDAAPEIVLSLLIAMVVHEAGHAIYCRRGNIRIKSTGIILASIIPLGAFVEPDEKEQNEASTIARLKMFSAGIMNNFAVFFLSISLFLLIVSLVISPISGAGVGLVYNNSVTDESNLDKGDVIQFADNKKVSDRDEFRSVIQNKPTEYIYTEGDESVNISGGAYVYSASSMSNMSIGNTVVSADDKSVKTVNGLYETLQKSDRNINVTYKNGETDTIRLGAYVVSESKFSSAIVHSINQTPVRNKAQFEQSIPDKASKVEITFWSNGNLTSEKFDMSEISNFEVRDRTSAINLGIGAEYYPKDEFYDTITFGNNVQSTIQNVIASLFLPIASIVPTISFGFPGFTDFVQNFYTVDVEYKILSSFLLFIASVLFWSSWININLAIFNSIPTFALDGGHILSASVEHLIGDPSDDFIANLVDYSIKILTLVPLILLIVLAFVN